MSGGTIQEEKKGLAFRVLFGYDRLRLTMEAEVGEKIKVLSLFENGKIKPEVFLWRKKVYRILRVVFSYSKNIGREKIFYFSVDTGGGIFEISFCLEKFSWEIEKIF